MGGMDTRPNVPFGTGGNSFVRVFQLISELVNSLLKNYIEIAQLLI